MQQHNLVCHIFILLIICGLAFPLLFGAVFGAKPTVSGAQGDAREFRSG
jgi:hypothetical protein